MNLAQSRVVDCAEEAVVDVLRHLGFGPLLFLLPVSWHLFFFFVSVLDALPQENADLRL